VKNSTIKLIAKCARVNNKVYAYVMPQLVPETDTLNKVAYEYNGLLLEGAFSEHQFFMGKGAGGNSTGSAVLDISALLRLQVITKAASTSESQLYTRQEP
jgi:homoserine dehydrogenase